MAKISTYSTDALISTDDKLIGTDAENSNATKNFFVGDLLALIPEVPLTLPTYASNAAALAGGLVQGQLYKSVAGVVSIVL